MRASTRIAVSYFVVPLLFLLAGNRGAFAQGPDIVCGDIPEIANFVADDGMDAFSIGTLACNTGDEVLDWIADTNQHPVIAQNMFRLVDGRFEQIGMSWLKHGFAALQEELCGDADCTPNPGGGSGLGIGCSDPYSAAFNALQSGLGPRSQVNPATGEFEFPFEAPSYTGRIARRLQVALADLDPDLNFEAKYFVEAQYVCAQDAGADNDNNNNAWRAVTISQLDDDNYSASFSASAAAHAGEAAISAWKDADSDVTIIPVDVPVSGASIDGRMLVAYLATEIEPGRWSYEYAIQNVNSDRGARSFATPLPAGLDLISPGFHDIDHHSGEPYEGTDWSIAVDTTGIAWSTAAYEDDPDANALRWGTLYNFRFECNSPPARGTASIGLFKPGESASVDVSVAVPSTSFTLPVETLSCGVSDSAVELSWSNAQTYDGVRVLRDEELIAILDGDSTSFDDEDLLAGLHQYSVRGVSGEIASAARRCEADVPVPLTITFLDGAILEEVPSIIDPQGETIAVEVKALAGAKLDSEKVLLHVEVAGRAETYPLSQKVNDIFAGEFPATTCGATIHWCVSARSEDGVRVIAPPDGLTAPLESRSAALAAAIEDNMEEEHHWGIGGGSNNASSGAWERGEPVGSIAQPFADHTPGAGTDCWFTGQGEPGEFFGENDVDDGSTTLTSPVFYIPDWFDVRFSYWRWYSNSTGANPASDFLSVMASADGESWVEVERVGPNGEDSSGGWFQSEFSLDEFLPSTGTFQIRFVASDFAGPSVIEAAIDDFRLSGFLCAEDCDADGTADSAQIEADPDLDCNANGLLDSCDVAWFASLDLNENGSPDECEAKRFVRGDCNEDAVINIADPIRGLIHLFLDGPAPVCYATCDVNDDGSLAIGDMVYLLAGLFAGGPPPKEPYPECGEDPTPDSLPCAYAVSNCD